jgi:hydroxymethylbilane synthase
VLEPRSVALGRPGCPAVECADDDEARALLATIDHAPSHATFDAERGFLRELGGDCDLPAGAHARWATDTTIELEALLASLDGHVVIRRREGREQAGPGAPGAAGSGADPERLGRAAARYLLDEAGGRSLLDR